MGWLPHSLFFSQEHVGGISNLLVWSYGMEEDQSVSTS
jgi:hypothetical protein